MQQRTFRWVGQTAPRAQPIDSEIWEKHREEMCKVYETKTLDDLMMHMKVLHNFEAT